MSASNSSKVKKVKKSLSTPRKLDFSNQFQPIPSQNQQIPQLPYPNQQIPQLPYPNQQIPQSPYPNQQILNPNLQYLNPNQLFSNQQLQFLSQQFSSQPQFLNQLSNPQYLSQDAYSHQPINLPSPDTPSYTNMLTQPSPQNDEADLVTKESRPYTHEEDICLARAYIPCSENPSRGRDQSGIVWWNDIAKLYNEEALEKSLPKRDPISLKNRFRRLQHEVKTYIEAEKFVSSIYKSGWDQVQVNDKIDEAFKERNGQYNNLSFKCGHVLGLLRGTAKFNFITTRNSIPRDVSQGMDSSPSTPIIGSNESPDQSREYHSGDKRSRTSGEEEVSSPVKHPQRPMGNKAAKKAAKGKAKAGGASNMSIDEGLTAEDRKWMLQEELSLKRQSHADRMKLLQEVSDNQAIAAQSQALMAQNNARRLDMEQQKIQLRIQQIEENKEIRRRQLEQERDMNIINKDLNTIVCDEQREKWRRMQQKIWDKWNL